MGEFDTKIANFPKNVQFAKNDHSIGMFDLWIIIDLTVLFNLAKMTKKLPISQKMFNLPKMIVPSKFPTRELLSIWQFYSFWQKWPLWPKLSILTTYSIRQKFYEYLISSWNEIIYVEKKSIRQIVKLRKYCNCKNSRLLNFSGFEKYLNLVNYWFFFSKF